MKLGFCLLLGIATLGCLAGCGSQVGTVSGQVTVDGQPLTKGVISFVPEKNPNSSTTVEIVNGNYTAQVVAGKSVVQISAPIVTGTFPEHDGPGAALLERTEESLPAKYHSASELSFEVKPGSNTQSWSLEALKKLRYR
ncbi:hypothetical protein NA78x_002244 [Anatilimnocola sp. NA78]|uniref:hypothetical protein n=1 Tax=Anatilimnocola sp. NA78 TaxID=3415683 RepID=UPI003CE46CB9